MVHLDVAAAEAAPGVLGVLTARNAPRVAALTAPPADRASSLCRTTSFTMRPASRSGGGRDAASGAARGRSRRCRLPRRSPPIATLQDGLADAIQTDTGIYAPPVDITRGDAEHGLAEADVVIEQTYTTSIKHHNPMEPSATIAIWEGDRLTLYDATQGISFCLQLAAHAFGLPPENVRVINHFVGGGFGCKGSIWPHTILAAMAARAVGRPVKLVLTRAAVVHLARIPDRHAADLAPRALPVTAG